MKVYQLWVRGPRVSWFGEGTYLSREVFITREAALAHLPEMDKRCRGLGSNDLTEVTSHGLLELDLVGLDAALGELDSKVDKLLDREGIIHRVEYGTPGITPVGD